MSYAIDVLIIIFLFALFAVPHSLLASKKIKIIVKDKFGDYIAFYRLAYNGVAVVTFVLVYLYAPRPDYVVYDLPYPWDLIILIPQLLAGFGFLWTIKFIHGNEFLGITQIKRYFSKSYDVNDLDEKQELVIKGPFKYVRHPFYFYSILFLGLRPTMSLFYLTFYFCFIAYFYIGSIYEEKKLVESFGVQYKEYQEKVPRLIPYRIFNPNY